MFQVEHRMTAFSEGLHLQGKPPQPLLPWFPMGDGEKDIIENDRTLKEKFHAQGACSVPD